MNSQLNEEKARIRKIVSLEKKKYSNIQLEQFSNNILNKLENTGNFHHAKIILAYWSLPGEVFTHDFIKRWWKEKKILLPVVNGLNLDLKEFHENEGQMIKGRFNISEPAGEVFTDFEKIDLAIIPGVAFDKNNNRLGRGKGFYDRLLPNLKAIKIGLCFPFQFFEQIPADKFDIRMDEVISINN